MIVTGERVAQWVSHRLDYGLCPPYSALGTEIDGTIVNGIVINHFEGADCHCTAAGQRWSPSFVKAFGAYVFEQLGCLRFTVITESEGVAKLACRLGGEREGLLRNHFGYKRDGIICGILRQDWRYATVPEFQRH